VASARTVGELIRERFGLHVAPRVNRSLTSVGTTAARLWPNDPDRLAALLVNLSVNQLWGGWWPDVSSTKGIRVGPSGGSWELVWYDDFDLVMYEAFVIADVAASTLLTVEWVATG
jgi:hypothetical protein